MAFYRSTLVRILATIRISAPQMRVAMSLTSMRFLSMVRLKSATTRLKTPSALLSLAGRDGSLPIHPRGAEASAIIYSLMETAKANSLRLDDDLLHLLSILPERAERNKDFEVDDLLPWSEEMKSWFSAV